MIPFTNTPWQVDGEHVVDSTGNTIAVVYAYQTTNEELDTLLRAISQLPAILHILGCVKDGVALDAVQFDIINGLLAYIWPIEYRSEVVASRWLHAHDSEAATPTTIQELTYALRAECSENLTHYPQIVQDAFAQALSLLNLAKHRPQQFASTHVHDGDSGQVDISPMFTTPQVHTVEPAEYASHPAVTDHYKKAHGI